MTELLTEQLEEVPEVLNFLQEFAPTEEAVKQLYVDWCAEDIGTFMRIVGILMEARAPSAYLKLMAEHEVHTFAEAWKDANG